MPQPAFLVFGESDWTVRTGPISPPERWMELLHAECRTRAFVLLPGETIASPLFTIDADHAVYLQAMPALPRISDDGLDLTMRLVTDEGSIELARVHLGNATRRATVQCVRIELRAYEGATGVLELECGAGANGDPTADWAGLVTLTVASVERISHATARSQFDWRLANETGHFTAAYSNELYRQGDEGSRSAGGGTSLVASDRRHPADCRVAVGDVFEALRGVVAREGESPFLFAIRMLRQCIPRPDIDFAGRLRQMTPHMGPLRVLSLCSGAARIEAELLRNADVAAELTLIDLNDDLLDQAVARMPAKVECKRLKGLADELWRVAEPPYDVVCFVSGIHHLVELESTLEQIRAVLAPRGELWLIGEQLGRNGNRMWPDARRVAERLFAALPERLRLNRNTQRIDARLPDFDYGSTTFEGVRSEDIQGALARFFVPVQERIRNSFLWRLVDLAYFANFDLSRADDVETLKMLVAEEYAFYANGGLGCELNGVYRDKLTA